MKRWMYNEFKQCGVDYNKDETVEDYDNQHQKFRDYKKEFNDLLEFLNIKEPNDMSLLELGCGTGANSIYAAECFKKVYAVDVSERMIQQIKIKVKDTDINNIEFINAGFLSYNHNAEQVDLLTTKFAFHHLPDFWKQIALMKMNKMIKLGGSLHIFDVVFGFDPLEYEKKFDNWISDFENAVGKDFGKEVEIHIKEEYSTFKWILEGMFKIAGFKIVKSKSHDEFTTEYHCIKEKNIDFK